VEEGGARVARSAAQRAQQLADVAAAVYEAGGRAIHLPLEQAHPLVAVLRAALGAGARGDLKVGRIGLGRAVAVRSLGHRWWRGQPSFRISRPCIDP
jgi:hypothetical protein